MTITSASSAITKTLSSTQDIGLGAQLAQGLLSYSKESLLLVSQEISPGQAYGDATSSVHVARTFGDSSVSRVIMGHTQDKQLLVRTIGRIAGYAGSTVATRAAKLMSEESSAEDFLALTKRSKDKEVIKRVVYAGLCESPYFKQDLGMLHYMSLRIGPASLIPFAHALLDYRDQPSDQVHARLLANAQSIHNLVYRQKAVDYVNKTRR